MVGAGSFGSVEPPPMPLAAERIRWRASAVRYPAAETQQACSDQHCGPPTDERKGKRPAHPAQTPMTFSWQDLTRPLAPTQDVTVLRGAGREMRPPSRSRTAPASTAASAPPHQTASGEVCSRRPPIAGPSAREMLKVRL